MTEIRELFDEAVSSPPPSRLTADGVYRVARIRRLRAAAAMVSLVMTVAGGVTAAASLSTGHSAHAPTGTALPEAVVWAGRGDATHLYVLTNVCPAGIPPTPGPTTPARPATAQCVRLLGSDDAGATWSLRSEVASDDLTIIGPRTLLYFDLSLLPTATPAVSQNQFRLSTDGGVTWRSLAVDGPPADALPPGGRVFGYMKQGEIKVYDPALERLRPLTHNPDLDSTGAVITVGDGQTLWVCGIDPQSQRPAIATTHDGGADWNDHVLPDTFTATADTTPPPNPGSAAENVLASASMVDSEDGQTGYLAYYDGTRTMVETDIRGTEGWGVLRAFQTTDGGDAWAPISSAATWPSYSLGWVTADGRIVLDLTNRHIGNAVGDEFIVSTDHGLTWSVGSPPGLPADLIHADGTFAYTNHAVYTSTDGWTWTQVWHD